MDDQTKPNDNCYCHFFYPELEQFKGEGKMKEVNKEDLIIYQFQQYLKILKRNVKKAKMIHIFVH